jgi:hypothetical protein
MFLRFGAVLIALKSANKPGKLIFVRYDLDPPNNWCPCAALW